MSALAHRPLLPSEALAVPRRNHNASAIVGLCASSVALIPFLGIPFSLIGAIASAIGIRRGRDGVYRRTAVVGLTVGVATFFAQIFLFACTMMLVRHFD